ncbi:MAG: hypothetical protein E6K65_01345 [Nitrospirae bacterium]|nr:MAG: hypothetical protein E6K65_01345 [Nitrospirota bacterium]
MPKQKIRAGSKVYIARTDGFETYLKAAITRKKVPFDVVEDRAKADYEIRGVSESKKAGPAKITIMGSWQSREEVSITVANIKTGDGVYAYSVPKENPPYRKQRTAEACAEHLKDEAVNPPDPENCEQPVDSEATLRV